MKKLGIVLGILVVLGMIVKMIVFPPHRAIETTGEYTVAKAHVSYVDEAREEPYGKPGEVKRVGARIWYPAEAVEKCPLVLFSHGYNGISISNNSLFCELASHGYVVVSVEHPYMSYFYKDDEDGKLIPISSEYLQEYPIAGQQNCAGAYPYFQKWNGIREADMEFVLEQIKCAGESENGADWAKMADTERLVLMGHSLGGSAALGLGRKLEHVLAVVALESPYTSDIIGVDEKRDEFIWEEASYPVPVLHIYSDCIWNKWDISPVYAENMLAMEGLAGETRNVHVEETGHLELTDLSIFSPLLTRLADDSYVGERSREGLIQINREVLSFLQYFVNGEGVKPDMH